MTRHTDPATDARRPAPFRHVLVATDFSTGAARAIARAARLPLAKQGKLTVAHVLSDRLPRRERASVEKLARREIERTARSLRRMMAASERPGVTVASELWQGQPYVEIIRHARSSSADLVVLGRHGHRPMRDMFLGSTAERAIRAGDLPTLVVSRKASRPYRRPVFAIALEDTCPSIITAALRVLGPEVANATMVHAYHVPFEGLMRTGAGPGRMTELRAAYRRAAVEGIVKLQRALGDVGIRWQNVIVRGDPRTAILGEVGRRRADFLSVGTHGRSGVAHALLGSVAEWLVRAAPCDVLVARPARVSFELP